jgi:hypothetical protein
VARVCGRPVSSLSLVPRSTVGAHLLRSARRPQPRLHGWLPLDDRHLTRRTFVRMPLPITLLVFTDPTTA